MKVSLATDNVPISLFLPIWQAVARTSYQTKQRVAPGEALSRADALRCATTNGAYLTFDEDKKGSLEPGKLADLADIERRSAHGRGSEHRRHPLADDHGRRTHRA